ncbi:hypothetical protein EKL98_02530 [Flavobacterium bomense]|uniref:Uncharacterized protein n=1 Tax=Flavobacterium bomense TaxID=2497483 RepID=A0A3S0PKJ0_9FLAO|nr:hypothetical protein [Flavobacterium bomense]RTZ08213.1 hypothetical protein EKL98_02530 [Flavobacterium bomense]
MKFNIFQKIAFLVYISIILLIFIYFVPYQNNDNYIFHSSIISDGYGTMNYFRFLIYLIVPTLSFYLVWKYLDGMNSLESNVYKKKAKRELFVFFVFAGIIIGSILFFYVKNEYSEIRKERLESQISEINNSFNILKEELNKRPPFVYEILKDNQNNNFVPPSDETVLKEKRPPLDLTSANEILKESKNSSDPIIPPLPKGFTVIKKPIRKLNLDLSGYYEACKKDVNNVLKKTFNVRFSVKRKTQLERNIKQLIYNESSSEDLNYMIIDYVKVFSEDGIKKTKLEFELRELNFYNVKFNVVFAFLGSFILLYIIRPLFTMIKGMLKEVS